MAWRAQGWYLGENDLGLPIATVADGGCYDGLMSDRVNLNQGAESILAFQFVCTAMTKAVASLPEAPGVGQAVQIRKSPGAVGTASL